MPLPFNAAAYIEPNSQIGIFFPFTFSPTQIQSWSEGPTLTRLTDELREHFKAQDDGRRNRAARMRVVLGIVAFVGLAGVVLWLVR